MDWTQLLPSVVILVGVVVLAPYFKKTEERRKGRLNDWAKSEGVTLISHRAARFYEGPGAWRRGEYQDTYRLEVRDGKGRVCLAWVTFEDTSGVFYKTNIEITNVTWS
jgi:hypothetical protein